MKNIIKRNELYVIFLLSIIIMVINVYPVTVNAVIHKVVSEVETYRIKYSLSDYEQMESVNFIYLYKGEDRDILPIVKSNAEFAYNELQKYYDYVSNKKIIIIVFPDNESMNDTLNLPSQQKSMGLYYSGFISVLSPKSWIKGVDKHNIEDIFLKQGPIVHELTHYFLDKTTKGNYPTWFTEGVALYFENLITGFEWGQDKKYYLEPYNIEDLTKDFDILNQDYAYRRSFEIIQEYVRKNGLRRLLHITNLLGKGYELEEFIGK